VSQSVEVPATSVSPEEIARRIAEYRRMGWEHRSPAIMVYPPDQQLCPWPGCGTRIAGVRFNLEQLGDPALQERLLSAWWQGPGLVGRCPGCGRHVLFGYEVKQAVADPVEYAFALLPEGWADQAHLAPRPTAGN
jgi:hypothetical protein